MKEYLTHPDWADDVKAAVNAFITENGVGSPCYDDTVYTVFDFDNTTAIFDVGEQAGVWQLQHMAFPLPPEELRKALSSGLTLSKKVFRQGLPAGTYGDWIDDILAAYSQLWTKHGGFTAAGLPEREAEEIQKDPYWLEFASKLLAMFYLVCDNDVTDIAYPWLAYWHTGMTEQEAYDLSLVSHRHYSAVDTYAEAWTGPKEIPSKIGSISCTWLGGVQVTEPLYELIHALHDNGIKVWICSASTRDIIRAAVDHWGLHDAVTGVMAMSCRLENGKIVSEYDYESGCGWLSAPNGEWVRDTVPMRVQTHEEGKVTAITNVLNSRYGHGPAAGFMDSSGDFNFCTEFKTLQLVLCFNRAADGVSGGGGLISELALHQRDTLGYDFRKARENGDTFYVLQGRDENGKRTLRKGALTLRFGSTEEKLFAGEENEKQLRYMSEHRMSTKDVLNTFALRTEADDPANPLGFAYGFLDPYAGYHTHD